MNYPNDLIAQARHLVGRGKTRPKQVDLRRAISAAYYAVFHALARQAAARAVGATAPKPFSTAVMRSFEHATMRSAADELAKPTPAAKLRPLLAGVTLPADARLVCQRFGRLQNSRHLADYDLSTSFTKAEAEQAVDDAEDTLRLIDSLKSDPAFARCLFALHSFGRLRRG